MPFQPHNDIQAQQATDFHPAAKLDIHIHTVNSGLCATVLGAVMLLALCAGAQTPQTAAKAAAQTQTGTPAQSHAHRHASRSKKHAKPKPVPAAVVTPPPAPLPPAQQAAQPAKIDFSQGALSIDAQNSSLTQILNQVSRQTGLEIQGIDHDERIYGKYGPDTVANTLTDLLDGSGYNYVMIGGGNGSPPTKLMLTPGSGTATGVSTPGNFAPPAASPGGAASPTDPPNQPADNSAPAQPKTTQEIFDELRKQHPQ